MVIILAASEHNPALDAIWRFEWFKTAQAYWAKDWGKKNFEASIKKVILNQALLAGISCLTFQAMQYVLQVFVGPLDSFMMFRLEKRSAHQTPCRK
jgi:hypothetical protein